MDAPDVMTLEEAAEYMRMSPRWLEESDVPRAKLGRRVVFVRVECFEYILRRLTHRVADLRAA